MVADNKCAVVVGGAGFLGRRLVALLAGASGFHPDWPRFSAIHVFDKAAFEEEAATRQAREQNGIELRISQGDIGSPDALRQTFQSAHTVFHLASMVHVGLDPNPLIDAINIEGTRNVVRCCQDMGVPFLVYTSSEDVVLSPTPVANGDESLPYPDRIVHDYVRTKIEGEKLVRAADDRNGLRTCSIRPVHIYGPEDPHAITVSLEAFASGTVPFLLGEGRARFDVVYVDNVAHAHLLAAARLHNDRTCDSVGGEAFFVGEGNAPNYFEWLRPYAESKGVKMPQRRLPYGVVALLARAMEWVHRLTGREVPFHRFHLYVLCHDFFFSNAKAERLLGYRPLVTPGEGLRRTLEWLKTVPIGAA